jgi:V/A-type H+-transporting ATPase subunit D
MAKFKLTKGELKRQRDALQQFQRYLPTLQLKKQQLQLEILQQEILRSEKTANLASRKSAAEAWTGLLSEAVLDFRGI